MPAVIDAQQADWMVQGGPSITLASSSAAGPSLGQGIGCRVDGSRQLLTVFLVEPRNLALLADLRAGRPVAVVFTHSASLSSLQLKAETAREVPLQPGDSERITAYIGSVVLQWSAFGTPESFTLALLARGPGAIVAFELVPYVAFDQTPGPRAGTPLRSVT
jgi:hypothetical protein